MVTIAEAQSQAKAREKEINISEQQLRKLQQPGTITEQFSLAKSVGAGGVGQELRSRRLKLAKLKEQQYGKLSEARADLFSFRGEIATAKEKKKAYETEQSEWNIAKQYYLAGQTPETIGVTGAPKSIKEKFYSVYGHPGGIPPTSYVDVLGQGVSYDPAKAGGTIGTLKPFGQPNILTPTGFKSYADSIKLVKGYDISSQVSLGTFTGTISQLDFAKRDITIYPPGTIYQSYQDSFKVDGKTIPITKDFFVQPDYSSRITTPKESTQLKDYIKSQSYSDIAMGTAPSQIKQFIGETYGSYQKFGAQPFYDEKYVKDIFAKGGKPGELIGGAISNYIIPSTKGQVVTTGLIYGAGVGLGFAIKGGTSLISAGSTKLFGATAGAIMGTGIKAGTYGAGAYLTGGYLLGKGEQFSLAPSYFEKGQLIGGTARELTAGFYGFKTGAKGYDIVEGLYRTRGRSFINIPQGEYPTAATSKQLGMFQKNIIKELSGERISIRKGYYLKQLAGEDISSFKSFMPGKPGAFHTTGQTFWEGGTITPTAGTSELPGLYGSTQISTSFARITGISSKTKFFPSVSEMLSPPTKPGVAFLTPKGFRYSPAIKDPLYFGKTIGVMGGKQVIFKTGTADFPFKFTQPVKPGYADVPLIKTEIEAVFRPGAGIYGLESAKYYTKISGVRVPIDVFSYQTGSATGLTTPTTFKPGSYSSYTPPSFIDLRAGISAYSSGVSKTLTSSYLPSIKSSSMFYSSVPKSSKSYKSSSRKTSYSYLPGSKSSRSYLPTSRSFSSPSKVQRQPPGYSYTSSKKYSSPAPMFSKGFFPDPFKTKRVKKKKKKDFGFNIRPSFTSIAFNLKGAFPKTMKFGSKDLGISPSQLRVLPKKRKR